MDTSQFNKLAAELKNAQVSVKVAARKASIASMALKFAQDEENKAWKNFKDFVYKEANVLPRE